MSFFAGVDVGGTAIKAGVIDDQWRVLSSISLPTEAHQGQEHGLAQMCAAVRQAAAGAGLRVEQLAALGVGVPGTLDIPAGIILEPHNLKPWRNVPARRHLHDTFGLPTAFQNDANAAAYGEYKAGAGRGMRSLVLFTLGTGIGGGLILDDRIVEGEHSHGGEIGHILIETSQPRRCVCGRRGCLEAYAGATAVVQRTLEALKQDPGRSSLDSWLHRKDALTARDVFEAAAAGDALASKIVEETAFYLAVGAVNLMHTLDPDIVVFGGGMVAAGEPFLQRIRRHIEQLAFPVPAARTQIRFAQLGPDAGFIGAAGCGRQLQEVIRNQ